MTALALSAEHLWEEARAEAERQARAAAAPAPTAPSRHRDPAVLRLLGADAAAELAGHVSTAGAVERRRAERRRDAFATGLAPLDRLLDGGLPRGELVELVGRPGSGRFSAALAALATATGAGEAAALVDLGDHLAPETAAHLGVDPRRLLWLRPRTVGDALAAAETALNGGFPLVVLDLGTPPVPGGRGHEAGWVRLARAAEAHGAALLVSAPYRASGTAAHTVVTMRRGRAEYVGGPGAAEGDGAGAAAAAPLVGGLGTRMVLDKARGRRHGDEETVRLALPDGFAPAAGVVDAPGVAMRERRTDRQGKRAEATMAGEWSRVREAEEKDRQGESVGTGRAEAIPGRLGDPPSRRPARRAPRRAFADHPPRPHRPFPPPPPPATPSSAAPMAAALAPVAAAPSPEAPVAP